MTQEEKVTLAQGPRYEAASQHSAVLGFWAQDRLTGLQCHRALQGLARKRHSDRKWDLG